MAASGPPPLSATPPWPIVNQRRDLPRRKVVLLLVLGLLMLVGDLGLFNIILTSSNARPHRAATVAIAATTSATIVTPVTQIPNPYPPGNGKLALSDALRQPMAWENDPNSSFGACQFSNGTYHVSRSKPNGIYLCSARALDFSNFAFQVQMTIIKGDCGGIGFRNDGSNRNLYLFQVCQDGGYSLLLYTDKSYSTPLLHHSSSAIVTGLNQPNVLAVVANGTNLDLYVNNWKIETVNDSTYSHGQLSLSALANNDPTEVVYSDAKVWTL
jgi:hypothetical protein